LFLLVAQCWHRVVVMLLSVLTAFARDIHSRK
jgi:hypothetical protein